MNKKIKDFFDPFVPTLLISIHEKYVKEILAGAKIIEYRKRFFADDFQAFVYTTGKSGGIQLFMKCAQPIKGSAKALAQIGQQIQHDDYDELYNYFILKNAGCAIPILETSKLKKISLIELRNVLPRIVVPQAYLFLNTPDKKKLFDYLINQNVMEHKTNDWSDRFEQIGQITKSQNNISLF